MTKKATAPIDMSLLRITDDPYRGRRPAAEGKYDPIFAKITQGKRLVCPSGHAGKIAQLLRKWLQKQGTASPLIRSVDDYGDGMGGVWWLGAKEPKTALAKGAPWPTVAADKRKAA